MSIADFVLSVSAMHEAALTALAIFLTVLSGYLVVAYSVGADLTKSQLIFINSIFIVFGLTLTLGIYTYLNGAFEFGLAHYPEASPRSEGIALAVFLLAKLASILGALKFMFDIRKKNSGSADVSDT